MCREGGGGVREGGDIKSVRSNQHIFVLFIFKLHKTQNKNQQQTNKQTVLCISTCIL